MRDERREWTRGEFLISTDPQRLDFDTVHEFISTSYWGRGMPRAATQRADEDRQWVAELECGHTIHMRHDPPWQNRPWVLSAGERAQKIGVLLDCLQCAQS